MTAEQPHPLRCETCGHRKMHHNSGLGTDRPRCEITKWFLDFPTPENSIEHDFVEKVGCASHTSAAPAAGYLITPAELDKLECCYEENCDGGCHDCPIEIGKIVRSRPIPASSEPVSREALDEIINRAYNDGAAQERAKVLPVLERLINAFQKYEMVVGDSDFPPSLQHRDMMEEAKGLLESLRQRREAQYCCDDSCRRKHRGMKVPCCEED